ncbi:hypothetical protein [Nocardiopsis salina]|uniref:hypothetical protein n=1 Tax=Nocardiopsis salina TaxID=245836 RepID=UPI000346342A|nr:hypothetical protein [Nocardiopsis salina]
MASSIAAAILLIAGIVVAVNVSGGRAYAELPTCRQLIGDLADEIPGTDRPSIDGDFETEDVDDNYTADLEGVLNCEISESGDNGQRDGSHLMSVGVFLYDHEDERGMRNLQHDMDDSVEDLQEPDRDEDENYDLLGWEATGAGDVGYVSLQEYSSTYSDDANVLAMGSFLSQNVWSHYTYEFDERDDEEEILEFLASFGEGIARQLRSEAEFV